MLAKKENVMGEIVVDVVLENRDDLRDADRGLISETDVRRETIRAIADTGAGMLALPEDIVERLGIPLVGQIRTLLADGSRDVMPVADGVHVHVSGREMTTDCIVVPLGADALIGQQVMERLDLIADCKEQTLRPRPESIDMPLQRL